jgi:hypothetical protein
MVDWHIPLVVAAIAFVAFFVWRLRPVVSKESRTAGELRAIQARVASATDDEARATALADAGDLCAKSVSRSRNAVAFYLRAMRAAPSSVAIAERAVQGLHKRPRAFEALAWRRLGSEKWTGADRDATLVVLRALAHAYDHDPKHRIRARAIEHCLEALGAPKNPPPAAD